MEKQILKQMRASRHLDLANMSGLVGKINMNTIDLSERHSEIYMLITNKIDDLARVSSENALLVKVHWREFFNPALST